MRTRHDRFTSERNQHHPLSITATFCSACPLCAIKRFKRTPRSLNAALASLKGPALHVVLERQYWRLSYWQTAAHEINYRRFFDVDELIGLRMERADVFAEDHRLLGHIVAHPAIDGVRIDHIDGLFDPHGYLEHVRALGARAVWVEKILAAGETLPPAWSVDGTVGYEFLNDVVQVLTPPAGQIPLVRVYRRYTGDGELYTAIVHDAKRLVMATALAGELFRLGYELDRLSEADYHTRDFTFGALREALAEIVAAFPRYRTYLPHDREVAAAVIREAVEDRSDIAHEWTLFDIQARFADVVSLEEALAYLRGERAEQ